MNNIFNHLQFEEGVLEETINNYMKYPERAFGCLGEQTSTIVDLHQVSHRITKLTATDFEFEILETPNGKILKDDINSVKFKPRLIGEYHEGKIINALLISIDACYE